MIKQITFAPSSRSTHQLELFASAAAGLKRFGVESIIRPGCAHPGTKAVACWGWRAGLQFRRHGHDVLVFERAYLGDRFYWTSLAWNGLNARADFCLPEKLTGERFEKNFEPLKPWKTDGEYIVIMGQVPGDMSLQGYDLAQFYETAAGVLKNIHKKPVYFRPHPHGKTNFKPDLQPIEGDLEGVIDRAYAVVTYNSNTGVDAVVRGIPALSMDQGSMAYEVTSHALTDKLVRPDRSEWAARLAHCQWRPEEIANGDFWERLGCYQGD